MTVEETADALHVSLRTLRHWIRTGKGPQSARIGKRRYFRRDDVEAWVTSKFSDQRPA